MKKRSILNSIEVKTPCSQNWESMYGNDVVRFCEHCVKNVHNLSAMTRKDAEKLVARSKGGICIQYVRHPDGKIQTMSDKLYQISGRASRLAAGIFGASLSLATAVMAQTETAPPEPAAVEVRVIVEKTAAEKEKAANSISGVVTDPNGAIIPGARVTLTDQKTGVKISTTSDSEGNYIFSTIEEGTYTLTAACQYFTKKIVQNIQYSPGVGSNVDVQLDVDPMVQSVTVGGAMVVSANYENELIKAVDEEDLDRIKQLIGQGVNVNVKDENEGLTALHVAVNSGNIEIVQLLLNAGAKVNARDKERQTPMMHIAENYYPDDEYEEQGEEAEESAEEAAEGATEESAAADEAEVADKSESKTTEKVKSDSRDQRAVKILNLLIAYGAKINLRDSDGFTALMYAAQNEEPEVLHMLISHRAEVNLAAKNGRTALMEAANAEELENVKVLLGAGAEVNLKDKEGDTAWDLTTHEEIEDLLVAHGAIVEQDDEEPEPQDN